MSSSKHKALNKKKGTEHNEENVEYKGEEGHEGTGKRDGKPSEHKKSKDSSNKPCPHCGK